MSQAGLVWSPDTIQAGKRFVPRRRLLLVAARWRPQQDSIQLLCGMKNISQEFFWDPMVCSRPHCRNKCALTHILLKGVQIAQVHIIFKLPDHLGLYPHPLAYVEWFTSLCRRDPISGQFIVTHSMRNHRRNVAVISMDRFTHPCHLQAQCGRSISSDWSSENVLEIVSAFHVNSYIDLDTFVALASD